MDADTDTFSDDPIRHTDDAVESSALGTFPVKNNFMTVDDDDWYFPDLSSKPVLPSVADNVWESDISHVYPPTYGHAISPEITLSTVDHNQMSISSNPSSLPSLSNPPLTGTQADADMFSVVGSRPEQTLEQTLDSMPTVVSNASAATIHGNTLPGHYDSDDQRDCK